MYRESQILCFSFSTHTHMRKNKNIMHCGTQWRGPFLTLRGNNLLLLTVVLLRGLRFLLITLLGGGIPPPLSIDNAVVTVALKELTKMIKKNIMVLKNVASNLSQFSHICALFCLHLEGGISQQPFKSCLASLG